MEGNGRLILIGASVRAAAFSALRAGFVPWCVDLFADRDLRARCEARRLRGEYPAGFDEAMEDAPDAPWMYTGGLENAPALVDRLAGRRGLLGNGGSVLRCVRRPELLVEVARSVGLPAPRVGTETVMGRWLVKPRGGAGGLGIRFAAGTTAANTERFYLQEYVEGTAVSAVYVGHARGAELVGVTRQLVGESFLRAEGFLYCGSVGPLPVKAELRCRLTRLGEVLVEASGMRGVFGVDGILRAGEFWPVEVNPRYPASVEVLEHALGVRVIQRHWEAVTGGGGSLAEGEGAGAPRNGGDEVGQGVIGRAVLYARETLTISESDLWREDARGERPVEELPQFADLPGVGERIEVGHPVLTYFVRGGDEAECQALLEERAARIEADLYAGR